jgi:hypothetical protein
MGFAPADVAAGVAEVLVADGRDVVTETDGDRRVFRRGAVTITVGPLPAERASLALFQPRTLLVVDGDGPEVDAIVAALRVKFLRVTG